MTLQTLPIMSRLAVGVNTLAVDLVKGEEVVHRIDQADIEELARFKRVALGPDQRIPYPTKRSDFAKIFGHLRLPFPRIWMEWEDDGTYWAARCERVDPTSWVMMLYHVISYRGSSVVRQFPYSLSVALHDDGTFDYFGGVLLTDDAEDRALDFLANDLHDGETIQDRVTALAIKFTFNALVSIGWMNCKNVHLREHTELAFAPTFKPTRKARGKKRRPKARAIDFHTIELPGSSALSVARGDSTGEGVRLHQVRGHFKTYTADAPLLGKFTGTYWWDWQVRGDKKRGMAVTDYKLGAAS